MSTANSPTTGAPAPGTAVAGDRWPAATPPPGAPSGPLDGDGGRSTAASGSGADGHVPAAPAATTQPPDRSGASLWARGRALLDQGWQHSVPAATWLTRKTAPLTRRAVRADLVQVAAGVAVTALAAVLIALAAQVQWHVGVLTAPLWLFMGAGLFAGTVLGPWRALLANSLYLVLGLVGAAWTGEGVGTYLDGPWAGVLLSLPVAALLTGAISARHAELRSPVTSSWYFFGWFFFAALTGVAIVYAGGLWTLFDRSAVDGWSVFTTMSARIPFDVAQCLLVAALATVVHRLVPGLLGGRRTRRRSR